MNDDLRFSSAIAAASVLTKIGIDLSTRDMDCQDVEYTSCLVEELSLYYELYCRDSTTDEEKRVLGCYFMECLNDHLESEGQPHHLQSDAIRALCEDKRIHSYELDYRIENGWSIAKYLVQQIWKNRSCSSAKGSEESVNVQSDEGQRQTLIGQNQSQNRIYEYEITMSIEVEFKENLAIYLSVLTDDLTAVLRRLVEHDYPKEVDTLSFEVFDDNFTSEFPVRAFFMDQGNSEHFITIDGKAEYPSPVDPGLLNIECVYPIELEEEFESRDEDFDPWDIATTELIE